MVVIVRVGAAQLEPTNTAIKSDPLIRVAAVSKACACLTTRER
jgi:hypothetical protein